MRQPRLSRYKTLFIVIQSVDTIQSCDGCCNRFNLRMICFKWSPRYISRQNNFKMKLYYCIDKWTEFMLKTWYCILYYLHFGRTKYQECFQLTLDYRKNDMVFLFIQKRDLGFVLRCWESCQGNKIFRSCHLTPY